MSYVHGLLELIGALAVAGFIWFVVAYGLLYGLVAWLFRQK